jgi:glucan phosphoethanolaminetransferase (alkaline phosphatase superfamily)
MELDELKDIWKKTEADFQPKAEAELAVMLKGNSKSIVAKIKRSVWFELIFTLVAGMLLLIYALTLPSGALKWISISILLVFVAYTFYYVKKLMLLSQFAATEDNLKATLEKLIDNLTSYLKFYKRSYSLLYPVYFLVALVFVAIERGFDEFLNVMAKPKTIAYLLLIAGLFFFCSTWLVNWFLKKLYGRHLEKLKSLLNELKSYERPEAV